MNLIRLIALLYFLCLFLPASAQQSITISGCVRDAASSEILYNATVYEINSRQGTVSNAYGFFSLSVPVGKVNLQISYVGYQQQQLGVTVLKDSIINFDLRGQNNLQEVIVKAKKQKSELNFLGHEHVSMEMIKELPGFLGEQDVLKSLIVLPGVQQGHEGSAGLFVRGGSPDQNLIILDGVPVYNASHLFGFLSVFTPEALQRVDFYKGGFPARYGGRLSSVIDVRMKDGNKKETKTDLTLGLVSSKLTHEGPIRKGKSSFLISVRRTLLDLLVTGAAKINKLSSEQAIVPGLNFYDLNVKLNFDLDAKNRLYFSFYTGGDNLFSRFTDSYSNGAGKTLQDTKVNLAWGNMIGAVRWSSQIGNKLFLSATLSSGMFRYTIHNKYKQKLITENEIQGNWSDIRYMTFVNNNKLNFLFDWYLNNKNKIQFGASGAINWFIPGRQNLSRNEGSPLIRGNRWVSNSEIAFFVDDRFEIGNKISVYGGLRLDLYETEEKWFTYLSPRINLQFHPSSHYNLNLSYAEMAQPIHLLTNSSIGLPSDIWVPATKEVKPEFSRQISLGTTIKLSEYLKYKFDSYYKTMSGVINYQAGYSFMDIYEDWETLVEDGKGEAWGFEHSLNYENQQIKTWLNYTLSWNNRRFEHINKGKPFPYKFDRRNDINLGVVYKFSNHFELSAMWVFQTGQAATLPQQDYSSAGEITYSIYDFVTGMEIDDPNRIQYIEGYNNYRLPAFHHLDLGLTFRKQRKSRLHEWKLGVYNIYARQNAYMYYPHTDSDGYRKYKQISLFPFVPSISYHVKF